MFPRFRKSLHIVKIDDEEIDRRIALILQRQDEAERLEEERRDYEYAVKLSKEINKPAENTTLQPEPECSETQIIEQDKTNDLSKWKYAELRDAINSSCDDELLQDHDLGFNARVTRRSKYCHPCRTEHLSIAATLAAWHVKRPTSKLGVVRPKSSVTCLSLTTEGTAVRHRYFRIPITRVGCSKDANAWWYAHFNGRNIVRLMKLYPDLAPVLLQAGMHDTMMCDLSLEEIGLTRMAAIEINQLEFEREWSRYGGASCSTQ